MNIPLVVRRFALTTGLLAWAATVHAQTAANVLLVVNDASPASKQIGEYYARKRGVRFDQIVHLNTPTTDEISRTDFERSIDLPLVSWFNGTGAHDRILYIVLTKGIPLRIAGTAGLDGTTASVDSELTVLYRKLTGVTVNTTGRVDNPYFAGTTEPNALRPFSHETYDIFLVTRLDGFTVEDVTHLIDRGSSPVKDGKFVLDGKGGLLDRGGDAWLQAAATRLTAAGLKDRVIVDTTSRVITGEREVLGYYSWGSNDPAIKRRHFDFTFVPGALAGMYVSSDGRTFAEPPEGWNISTPNETGPAFAGSPQSLAGDLIRDGITGAAGHVAEPFLDATVRPDILFPAYVSGLNLAEAFYAATPFLSWQTIVIGDPLCAPFRTPAQTIKPDPGLDSTTELPAYFSARRVKLFMRPGGNPEAAALTVRAQTRLVHGNVPGAREDLERATMLDTKLEYAQQDLAVLYDVVGDHDKAIERYQAVLTLAPNNAVALNNLAYDLAAYRNQPAEALPFAERAFRAAPQNIAAIDTLAWVRHLAGQNQDAARLLATATSTDAAGPAIRLHAAIVFEAVGRKDDARRELDRALKLSPDLAARDEVVQLQKRLTQP